MHTSTTTLNTVHAIGKPERTICKALISSYQRTQSLAKLNNNIIKGPVDDSDRNEMKSLCSQLNIPADVEETYFTLTLGTKINYLNTLYAEIFKTIRSRKPEQYAPTDPHKIHNNIQDEKFYEAVSKNTQKIEWLIKYPENGTKVKFTKFDDLMVEMKYQEYLNDKKKDKIPMYLETFQKDVEIIFSKNRIDNMSGKLKRNVYILDRKFKAPFFWEEQNSNFLIKRVEETSGTYDFIANKFSESLKDKKISSIHQIQNQIAHQKYSIKRDMILANQFQLSNKSEDEIREENDKILFFAQAEVSNLNVRSLIEEVDFFNSRRLNLSEYCCFTESATFADQFSFVDNENGTKQMVVAFVSVGNFMENDPEGLARPGYRDSVNGMPIHYDSVLAKQTVNGTSVDCWNIYESHAAYPAFIIDYQ